MMMMMMEEEFEIKDDEPWFDKQDLEHDLQLAAELGKSLLERNRELEQGLSQMCSTNQEQLQEIEYLTKQVELLRQVNDQHAKVYEQLDSSARDLEQSNHKLNLDNRGAQQKILGLTETVELLQSQLEELQQQVEDMKISSKQTGRPRGRQSISCLKELDTSYRMDVPDHVPSQWCWHEEEKESLRESLQSLQTQFSSERSRRERAEREAEVLANENAALEQQLGALEGCKTRLTELEQESEELRQLWKLRSGSRSSAHRDLSFILHDADEPDCDPAPSGSPRPLKRWVSERHMVLGSEERTACSCLRRHDAFKNRGISLLNEVDAQYSALQAKYEELLQSCHQGEPQRPVIRDLHQREQQEGEIQPFIQDLHQGELQEGDIRCISPDLHQGESRVSGDEVQQPEYKELFKKIFQHLQKTKEDMRENRGGATGRHVL